jgi:phosphocarrier protein FPr
MTTEHIVLQPHELVRLGAHPAGKREAIAEAAQMLAAAGCVRPDYEASMLRRESVANTYLGNGVVIPHGMGEDRNLVLRDGIAVLQVPAGIEWNPGETAKLVVAIAAQSDSHLAILRRLTRLVSDEARIARLCATSDPAEIAAALNGESAPAPLPSADAPADYPEHFDWIVTYPAGLHARPASQWVEAARKFTAQLRVRRDAATADAKSLIALLGLGLEKGASITVSAQGDDAAAALRTLRRTMLGLTAQEEAVATLAQQRAERPAGSAWQPVSALLTVGGVAAAPGLALGPLHIVRTADPVVEDIPAPLGAGAAHLNVALDRARTRLAELGDETAKRLGPADAAIFTAHAELLGDAELIASACRLMVEGHGVAWSWNQATRRTADDLAALGNPILAARAADLRDVGLRVLGELDPSLRAGSLRDLPAEPCIIVGQDLSPSDTAGLDVSRVVGLATAHGGPTSHTAILARTLGLPALVGGGAALLELVDGMSAIIDGDAGRLYLEPTEADVASARAWIAAQAQVRAKEAESRGLPATTQDGHRVAIGANINRASEAPFAIAQGAESVGLMRTEFLFLERDDMPSEDEQAAAFSAMAAALKGRELIVRALDIGGDKQVAHLDLPVEENPFLGVRGARLLLRRHDLLEPQIRAIYRTAKAGAKLLLMFPMITSVDEIVALRAFCEGVRTELDAPVIPLGIMIEVPAAALLAHALAEHVDFFSIGTNDLTQYTLAMDRQNPELAAQADALHPAVLRLIGQTVAGAAAHGRWVGVCGGLAGDPFGAALLTGLGVNELSMTPREVPAVKARLRGTTQGELAQLARTALDLASPADVRALDRSRA